MNRNHVTFTLIAFTLLNLLATGRWAIAPAAWIVPALALYLIHRVPGKARRGFGLLLLATYLSAAIGWYGTLPLPLPVYLIFMLINALAATVPFLLDRLITPRLGRGLATTLVFPVAATAVEYFMLSGGPLGSFGAQAYTQFGFGPLTQLASVTGLWGITFLMAWFAALANWAWARYEANEPYGRGLVVYGGVLAAVLLWGGGRLLTAPAAETSVAVASFTAAPVEMGELMGLLQADEAAFRAETQANHGAYLAQTAEVAATEAEIILWPELAGVGLVEDVDALVAAGQRLADEHDLYLAMPLFVIDPAGQTPPTNKVVVADPNGEIVLEHVKYGGNLLEGSVPGNGQLQTVETPFGTLSAVICWDTDYPAIVRQAGQQGVDLLLSPAYVWPEVARIHAEMATFRSLENGLTVVRQSDNGYSFVATADGRFITLENHVGVEGQVMTAEAALMSRETLYPVVGDVVGQVALLGLVGLVGQALVRGLAGRWRRAGAPAAQPNGVINAGS
jgi:apolipoprotein N-acyltransferase